MDKYMYWLDRIDGLGTSAKRNLLEAFGSAKDVYYVQEKYVRCILEGKRLERFLVAQKELEVEKSFEKLWIERIAMVAICEKKYPDKLRSIPDPPFTLYYKGELPVDQLPSVAIIGARECSKYGEYVATELGKLLGSYGIQVISGMAKGIDGISQSAALEAGSASYGVLGCGVDVCYPKSNKGLYDELVKRGGILSEYVPGTQPLPRYFPPRNRIVSGLSDALVVIEARQRSGTSITVEMALEQGRDVFAVPGRITDRLSDGCNKMLKEGAHVFLSPEDFLLDLQELLPMQMAKVKKSDVQRKIKVNKSIDKEKGTEEVLSVALEEILDFYPQPIDVIMEQLKERCHIECKQDELMSKLIYMCLLGQARQEGQGWFTKG